MTLTPFIAALGLVAGAITVSPLADMTYSAFAGYQRGVESALDEIGDGSGPGAGSRTDGSGVSQRNSDKIGAKNLIFGLAKNDKHDIFISERSNTEN